MVRLRFEPKALGPKPELLTITLKRFSLKPPGWAQQFSSGPLAHSFLFCFVLFWHIVFKIALPALRCNYLLPCLSPPLSYKIWENMNHVLLLILRFDHAHIYMHPEITQYILNKWEKVSPFHRWRLIFIQEKSLVHCSLWPLSIVVNVLTKFSGRSDHFVWRLGRSSQKNGKLYR